MSRPARPGDLCIVVTDPDNLGRNVGKQLTCDEQCRCYSDSWSCSTLEPFAVRLDVAHLDFYVRCPAGANLCYRKPHIIPLDDPDKSKEVTRLLERLES